MFNRYSLSLKSALSVAAVVVATVVVAGPAHAGKHCKNVYVSAVNLTQSKIKIIDLDYYDPAYQKWRSEPTPNQVIPAGRQWQETRRLEKVNAKQTAIRIKYRKPKTKGFGKWSKVFTAYSTSQVCGKGSIYEVKLR